MLSRIQYYVRKGIHGAFCMKSRILTIPYNVTFDAFRTTNQWFEWLHFKVQNINKEKRDKIIKCSVRCLLYVASSELVFKIEVNEIFVK